MGPPGWVIVLDGRNNVCYSVHVMVMVISDVIYNCTSIINVYIVAPSLNPQFHLKIMCVDE